MKNKIPTEHAYFDAIMVAVVALIIFGGIALWRSWDNTHAVTQPIIVKSELSREEFNILKPDIVRR